MKPLDVMEELLKDQDFSFWLDEARTSCQGPSVSILGSGQRRIEYWGREKTKSGIYVWDSDGKLFETLDDDILSYFQKQYECLTNEAFLVELELENELSLQRCSEDSLGETFPFQFRGGHVGYLGYEVRHDTARFLEEEESGNLHSHDKRFPPAFSLGSKSDPSVPTAAFLWADKSFVYDHRSGDWYLVGVASKVRKNERMEILNWLRLMSMRLQQGKRDTVSSTMDFNTRKVPINLAKRPAFNPRRSRKTYELNFDQCIDHIRQGESYELCLTNQLKSQISVPYSTPFGLYKILRRRNPAPFAAFFSWNAVGQQHSRTDAALAICCSSPERFVSVKRSRRHGSSFKFEVEAKPIKGTIARVQPSQHGRSILTDEEKAEDTSRANKLRNSVKDRAENLMIVDLLRNDLSRVCEPGSVHVTNLMDIESFATVHQMVSTIRGTLNPSENNAIDVLKACFPGGSMTGAPKIRTMELLDALEEGFCRGPYSGCLGYISLNGSMDMNIIIRTAVLTPSSGENEWNVSIGAGGAITALSESTDEYQELLLKASAVIESVVEWASASSSPLPESESGENKAVRIIGSCQRNSTLVGSV
jgi:para-aminobenzoate synthetase